jgi:hypothetical protein
VTGYAATRHAPMPTAAVLPAATVVAAVAVGLLVARAPVLAAAAIAALALGALVWVRPATAAVLVIAVTPLVAGIDRDRLVPGLRPNEAVVVFVAAVLALRAVVRWPVGRPLTLRLSRVEWTLVAMAVCASFVPLAFMYLRGRDITGDDLSHALVLWKYLVVYAVVRAAVTTQREVRIALVTSVVAASVVGLVGILQALDLLGVRELLRPLYTPFGYDAAIEIPRGSSTIGLPAATADLLVMNLAVVAGLWFKARRHALPLLVAASLFVVGTFAAAEFSSALGLVVGVVAVAAALRRLDLLRWAPLGVALGVVATWPAVQHRLEGFGGLHGMPHSWTSRLTNLQTYFWPELFSGNNLVLGVRPAARVPVQSEGLGFVWIESGYTWLLWGGGVALFTSYVVFVVVSLRWLWRRVAGLPSWSSVAALGALAGVAVGAVLMNFDPHLTYRAAADCLFGLLALAAVPTAPRGPTGDPVARPVADDTPAPVPVRRIRGDRA